MAIFGKLKLGSKSAPKKIKEKIIHHFVFVEVPIEVVWPEVSLWGQAEWWPKKSAIKIIPIGSGDLEIGSKFRYKIQGLLLPSWQAEVTQLVPENLIERTFLNGPLKGYESVKLEWRYNGTRLDYELHYRARGLIYKIIWPLLEKKIYNVSVKQVLEALRNYVVDKYHKRHESGLEYT